MYKSDKEKEVRILAKCHRSQRKNDHLHSINLDITPRSLDLAHCSCTVGYVNWKIGYFWNELNLQPALVADHIFFFRASGSCSHIFGLLMALQHWISIGFKAVPNNLTCTSLKIAWTTVCTKGMQDWKYSCPPPPPKKNAFLNHIQKGNKNL